MNTQTTSNMSNSIDWEKFKSLVHYICAKAVNPSVLSASKLNKVLWYSDSVSYQITGNSITGECYVKRQHGPVPVHVLKAVDALIADNKISRGRVAHFGFMKTEYIAIQDASVELFSADEIRLIDSAFKHVCMNHTVHSISEETHGIIWNLASMGEKIPYSAVFAANDGEVTEEDFEWAERVMAQN